VFRSKLLSTNFDGTRGNRPYCKACIVSNGYGDRSEIIAVQHFNKRQFQICKAMMDSCFEVDAENTSSSSINAMTNALTNAPSNSPGDPGSIAKELAFLRKLCEDVSRGSREEQYRRRTIKGYIDFLNDVVKKMRKVATDETAEHISEKGFDDVSMDDF